MRDYINIHSNDNNMLIYYLRNSFPYYNYIYTLIIDSSCFNKVYA